MGGVGPHAGTGPTTISIGFVAPNTGPPREEIFVFGGQQLILRQPVGTLRLHVLGHDARAHPANRRRWDVHREYFRDWLHCTLASPGEGVTITSGGHRGDPSRQRWVFRLHRIRALWRSLERCWCLRVRRRHHSGGGAEHSAERPSSRNRCTVCGLHACKSLITDQRADQSISRCRSHYESRTSRTRVQHGR